MELEILEALTIGFLLAKLWLRHQATLKYRDAR